MPTSRSFLLYDTAQNPRGVMPTGVTAQNVTQMDMVHALQTSVLFDPSVLTSGGITYATVRPLYIKRDQRFEATFDRAMVWFGRPFDFNQLTDSTATCTILRRHVTDLPMDFLLNLEDLAHLYPGRPFYQAFVKKLKGWVFPSGTPLPSFSDAIAWAHSSGFLSLPKLMAEAAITSLSQEGLKDRDVVIPTKLYKRISNLGTLLHSVLLGLPFNAFAFSERHPLLDMMSISTHVPRTEPYDYIVVGDTVQAFWAATIRLDKLEDVLKLPIDLLTRVERKDGKYWFTFLVRSVRTNDGNFGPEFRQMTQKLANYGYGVVQRLSGMLMWDAFVAFTPGTTFPKQFQVAVQFDAPNENLARNALQLLGANLSHSKYQGDIFVGKDPDGHPLMINARVRPSVLTTAVPRAGKSTADSIRALQVPFNLVSICCQSGSNAKLLPSLTEALGGEVLYVDAPDKNNETEEREEFKVQVAAGRAAMKAIVDRWMERKAMFPVCLQSRVTDTSSPLGGADSYAYFAFALGFCLELTAQKKRWLQLGNQRYEQRITLLVDDGTSIPTADATMQLGTTPKEVGDAFKTFLKNLSTTARGLGIWYLFNMHTDGDTKHFPEGFAETFGLKISLDSSAKRSGKFTAPKPGDSDLDVVYPEVEMKMDDALEELFLKLLRGDIAKG